MRSQESPGFNKELSVKIFTLQPSLTARHSEKGGLGVIREINTSEPVSGPADTASKNEFSGPIRRQTKLVTTLKIVTFYYACS